MNKHLGVAACQIDTVPGDVELNLHTLEESIKACLQQSPWVKLVCAPELYLPGIPNMETMAQEIPGPITRACADLARRYDIYLVPGSLYERKGERIYNSAPVFGPAGDLLAVYRKRYPWRPHEKTWAGSETCVFDLAGVGRVGLCICMDLWIPELLRDLVWHGAELILIPTATYTADRRLEIVLAQAAAITQQCFIVNANGTGKSGIGQSLIVDPEGNILQQTGTGSEHMLARLDLGRVASVRAHGTYGVTYPMASFFHERQRFDYQEKDYAESPLAGTLRIFG